MKRFSTNLKKITTDNKFGELIVNVDGSSILWSNDKADQIDKTVRNPNQAKYNLTEWGYNNKKINLNIAPNPSHLETVGAVVQGIARSKQDDHHKGTEHNVLPIVVHGDAAIAGQGIAYEIVQMAGLDGYKTQGTIHIVVNNQINILYINTST